MTDFSGRISEIRKVQGGGEATVYRALLDGKDFVALKVYADGKIPRLSEAEKALSEVSGVARFLGTGTLGEKSFSVLEYVRGVSSAELSPMPSLVALSTMRKLCKTLSDLGKRNILHGDLNPENVLFDAAGSPVLLDFGMDGLGAPRFAAPERFEGAPPTEKSELFSLGCLLYFWITGEPLFFGESLEAIEASVFRIENLDVTMLLHGRGTLNAEELSVFQDLWKGTLRKSPEDRFEDLDELDEHLEIAESGLLKTTGEKSLREKAFFSELEEHIREREARTDAHAAENWEPLSVQTPVFGTKSAERRRKPPKLFWLLLIFLCGIALCIYIGKEKSRSSDVETVGNSMLEKSRSGMADEPLDENATYRIRGIMVDADSSLY